MNYKGYAKKIFFLLYHRNESCIFSPFPQTYYEGIWGPAAHCDSEAAALTLGLHRPPKETVQRFGHPVIRPWRTILCFWQLTHTHTHFKRQLMKCIHKDWLKWCNGGLGGECRLQNWERWSPTGPSAGFQCSPGALFVGVARRESAQCLRWNPGPGKPPVFTLTGPRWSSSAHVTHPWVSGKLIPF